MTKHDKAEIAVGSYNLYQHSDDDRAEKMLNRFVKHIDVAGLQEFGGGKRRQMLRNLNEAGFHFYKPRQEGTAPAIVWRRSTFKFIEGRYFELVNKRWTGRVPGFRSTLGPLYMAAVELEHRATGQRVLVANWHAPSNVQRTAGPRRQMYRDCMDKMIHELNLANPGRPVFIVGDWNLDLVQGAIPVTALAKVRMHPMFRGKKVTGFTHDKRRIDGAFSNLRANDVKILLRLEVGDHEAAVGTYNLAQYHKNGAK